MAFVNRTIEVNEPADQVYARIVAWVPMHSGYQLSGHPGLVVVTRKYRPTWAIVLAVLGIFLCLLGLLFLLVTRTETLTITLTPRDSGGCTATIAGQADDQMVWGLVSLLSSSPPTAAQP